MNDKRLADRLHEVIVQAVEAMPEASAADLTLWARKHHRVLIRELQEQWINDRLASLFAAALRRQRPMKRGRPALGNPQQGRLPGFEHIPYRMFLEFGGTRENPGKRVYLRDATVDDLKQRRTLIRSQFSAEHAELNRLIAIMEPYDRAQPGITVREALKLQATTRRARKQNH